MKKATLTLGAGLILLTGWLLVPDIASAQALKTPIEGRWDNISGTGEPERVWVDEDGIRHVRGKRGWLRWVGNVRGWESWLTNWDDDRAGETWFEHGTASVHGADLREGCRVGSALYGGLHRPL